MPLPSVWFKHTLWIASEQRPKFFNVFYYEPETAPSFTPDPFQDTTDLGNLIQTKLLTNLPAVLTTSTHTVGAVCEMHIGTLTFSVQLDPTPVAGTATGDELPDYCAVIIQKRTSVGGKSGRGRWFLGPVPEGLTDENKLTGGAVALYSAVATNWGQSVTSAGVDWQARLHSVKDDVLIPVNAVHANTHLGVIRGRKSRPGL